MDALPLEQQLCRAGYADWLQAARRRLSRSSDLRVEFCALSAGAYRALGDRQIADFEYGTPAEPCAGGRWNAASAARAVLFLWAIEQSGNRPGQFACDVFRAGDEAEQNAVVRALTFCTNRIELKPVALEAGRSNNAALFGALLLDNGYPAARYDEREFNQLVLKALFLSLPIERMIGLAARANPELARMCADYVEEREAAARPVPQDIWLALAPHADARGRAMLERYRNAPHAGHRRYIELAMKHNQYQGDRYALFRSSHSHGVTHDRRL